MGYIQRRQGHWEESMRNLERALELDPRNINTLEQLSQIVTQRSGAMLKQKSMLDRTLAIEPNNLMGKLSAHSGWN